MISMRALVAMDRNGKHVEAGDSFLCYPIEAASLNYNRKAEFMTPNKTDAPASRSMRAERRPQAPAASSERAESGQGGRRTTAGGGYRRRDMAAPEDKS